MNKHIIYLFTLCLFCTHVINGNAQTKAINFSALYPGMTTGYLADKSMFSNRLDPFYKSVLPDTTTHESFYDALLLLNQMSISDSLRVSIEDVQDKIVRKQRTGLTPLVIVDYSIESINPAYLDQNVLGFDKEHDSLFSVIPVPDLFRADTVMMAYTPVDIRDRLVNFIISSDLYFTNLPRMKRFEVDFADGKGFRPIELDKPISVIYPKVEGDYEIRPISIRYIERRDMTIGIPRSYVKTLHKSQLLPDISLHSTSIPTPLCLPEKPQFADALVQVRFGKKNATLKEIRHPVVFIEGFDLDSDPDDDRFGSVTWHTLMTGLSFDESGNLVRRNLNDIKYLVSDLYEGNYDLVFIDFRDASNDLFANGNTVIKILKWLESQKVGNDGISVLGASMGGILARYAIRQMELTDCGHCVKLYGTFDSPHRGANIPIGLQHAVEFLSDVSSSARFGRDALRRIGAMQQLHYNIAPNATKYFNEWNNWHEQNGQPKQCRRIAITNSSPIGKNAPFLPGAMFYQFKHSYAGTLMSEIELRAAKNCQGLSNCNGLVFEGLQPVGSSGVSKFLNMYFGRAYRHKVAYASNTLPFDNITGSFSDWVSILHSAINQYLNESDPLGKSTFNYSPEQETTFITSASSLDMDYSILSPNLQDLFPDRLNSKLHPFDAIYYHNNPGFENQLHVKFEKGSGKNIEWILGQLEQARYRHPEILPISSELREFNLKGTGYPQLIGKVTINAGGILKLNDRARQGFLLDSLRGGDNWLNSTFSTSGCDAKITIRKGGVLMIGEESYEYPMSLRSELRIRNGSILEIHSGGTLHINDGSKVLIGEQSTLVVHPGAQVILDGESSTLILKGNIQLLNGATFSVKGGDKIGEVQFFGATCGFLSDNLSGGIIELFGTENSGDLNVTISSEVVFPSNLSQTRFERVKVNYSEGAKIAVNSGLYVNLSKFVASDLTSTGIQHSSKDSLVLKSSSFQGFKIAFEGRSNPSEITIKNCVFRNNQVGLSTYWKKVKFDNNSFIDNQIGFQAYLVPEVLLTASKFTDNTTAVFLQSVQSRAGLFDCTFLRNGTGVFSSGTNLNLGCNLFKSNDVALDMGGGVSVSIGSKEYESRNVGSNTFINNTRSVSLESGLLDVAGGANNFIQQDRTEDLRFFVGSISTNCNCLDSNHSIRANGNYWHPGVDNGQLRYAKEHYDLMVKSTPHPSIVKLTGGTNQTPNISCSNFQFEQDEDRSGKRFNLNQSEIQVRPNPSMGPLTFTYTRDHQGPAMIRLIDSRGVNVFDQKVELTDNALTLDLPQSVHPGIYKVLISTPAGVQHFNLIIQE